MAREERNMIGFTVALISEFASRFGVETRQAYAYMKRYKGLEHLRQHYAVLHTQSFGTMLTFSAWALFGKNWSIGEVQKSRESNEAIRNTALFYVPICSPMVLNGNCRKSDKE